MAQAERFHSRERRIHSAASDYKELEARSRSHH
jgi:hypothetical protein